MSILFTHRIFQGIRAQSELVFRGKTEAFLTIISQGPFFLVYIEVDIPVQG